MSYIVDFFPYHQPHEHNTKTSQVKCKKKSWLFFYSRCTITIARFSLHDASRYTINRDPHYNYYVYYRKTLWSLCNRMINWKSADLYIMCYVKYMSYMWQVGAFLCRVRWDRNVSDRKIKLWVRMRGRVRLQHIISCFRVALFCAVDQGTRNAPREIKKKITNTHTTTVSGKF